jgi:hypothetical protein
MWVVTCSGWLGIFDVVRFLFFVPAVASSLAVVLATALAGKGVAAIYMRTRGRVLSGERAEGVLQKIEEVAGEERRDHEEHEREEAQPYGGTLIASDPVEKFGHFFTIPTTFILPALNAWCIRQLAQTVPTVPTTVSTVMDKL